ncbi:HNH endonuclease signature motif containing protein [uncultured Acetatifactor sp.]|uniref:HNH endonuclease signature motif containing protein n=1 Tax=uncultured Acetatifactor sp. TaxID=1671927 RepID=UPI0026F407B1|nr:HNH endonuclease signature motif containing protein [uncultured Acetatifactor sp.]MCX4308505.1 HNH endonuclease signature motif containing protein [Acetatifactor sp.]
MWKWPQEVVDWLIENVPGRTTKEVTALINQQGFSEKYGMVFTEEIIKGAKSRFHIRSGTPTGNPKGYSVKYPKGMAEYVESIAQGKSTAELVEAVNRKYGAGTIGIRQMKAYKRNHGINTGLTGQFEQGHVPANKGKKMSAEAYAKAAATMFKKGNVPANHMEVGEYTHTTDGYLIQKVQETGIQRERFEFVHRRVWEEHNGPVPEGKMVGFLDGDKDNCSIENLVLLDCAENLELTRRGLRFSNAESTKAGVAVAKLSVAAKRKGKEKKVEHGNE